MSTQKSTKLSEYISYPYLIPKIYLDFDIRTDFVEVQSSMIIKPQLQESSRLVLKGNQIKLLSISIDGTELNSDEYFVSSNELIVYNPPILEFNLKIF